MTPSGFPATIPHGSRGVDRGDSVRPGSARKTMIPGRATTRFEKGSPKGSIPVRAAVFKSLLILLLAPLFLKGQALIDLGEFFPEDISANGSVLVGRAGFNGPIAKWENGQVELLSLDSNTSTIALSGDGSTIITESEKWVNGAVSSIIELGTDASFYAKDVSDDGTVIVGDLLEYPDGIEGQEVQSSAKIVNGVLQRLGIPAGVDSPTQRRRVDAISGDGRVVVGNYYTSGPFPRLTPHPIRWDGNATEALPVVDTGNPPFFGHTVRKVSADGSAAVGTAAFFAGGSAYFDHPVLWANGSVSQLTAFDGLHRSVEGISDDGTLVVGNQGSGAYVWTSDTGIKDLKDLLSCDPTLDLTGVGFLRAKALSSSGRRVACYSSIQGAYHGWLAKIPTLHVEILLPSPYSQVDVPFEATVSVSSTEPDPITVSFPDGVLTALDEQFLQVTVDEADPFVLSQEEPVRTFSAQVVPLKIGTGELTTTVEAMIEGALESCTATVDVIVPPLTVTLRALPLVEEEPIVNMELTEVEGEMVVTNEEGAVIEPKIEITVRNESDKPLDVLLQGLDPRARDESEVVGRIETKGEFPIELGTLGAGKEVIREIPLKIYNDGRFEFSALATGVYTGTDAQFSKTSTGAPIAVGERYPVQLELEVVRTPVITSQNNGAVLIQPGGTLKVIASVENLTTNSTLEFYGIKAEKKLNAFGAALTSDEGNQSEPAFVHDHSVEANSSVILSGLIRTNKDGAPSGTVTWQGLEDIRLIDDTTGEETELTMDDVLVKTTGAQVTGWLGDPLALRVIQDHSRPFGPPSLTLVQQTAVYGYGSMIGMAEWTYDTFDAIGGIGRLAGRISGDPDYLANVMGEFSRAVWEAAQLVATTWEEMSPQQKDEFIREVAFEVQRRGLLLVATRSPFDANDYNAAYDFTREATYSLFDGVVQAYASDDPVQIAELWGRVHGHVAMEVLTAAITEIKFTKYIEGAEAAKLAESASLGPALNNQEAALRAIRSGPLDESTALAAFGPGPEDLSAFQRVFKAFGVKGYARERAPLAYSLINEREVAIWKMEAMKPKGISDIDELLLGDNLPTLPGADGNPVELRAITAIFWPEPDDAIRLRLRNAGHSEEIVRAAIARAASRRKEYNKYFPEFRKWKREGIPMKRNYADNGIPDPVGQGNPTRTFDYDAIYRGNDGPAIYIPKVANKDGNLRFVSGDIDWVHFSFLDGTPLDPDTAIKLYDVLMDCCGLQHPETITWISQGRTIFESKIDQIAEYLRGEKALLELSGDGPRAVRISQNLTRFAANENARNHLIFFDNGIKSRLRATLADVETAFANLRSRTPARVFPPFLWATRDLDPETETKLDGKEWLYRTGNGDELLLRNNANGEIERFDGEAWAPWTDSSPSRVMRDNPDPLALTPTTGLAADAAAGSTELLVFDLPAMWPEQTSGRVEAWFAPGQTIIIAPGELTQETKTLLSVEPFILGGPLAFDHPEDTIVAVLPAGMTLSEPASILLSVVEDQASVDLVWASLPGRWYQLEVEANGIWLPVGLPALADGYAHGTLVPATDYDPAESYRLVEVDSLPAGGLRILKISHGSEDSSISLTWASTQGFEYQIEFSADDLAGFAPIGPLITAEDQTTTVVVSLPQGTAQAFCRVRQVTE